MMSTFSEAASIAVSGLRPGDPMRVFLEYMLEHARGRANAKTWSAVNDHLPKNGVNISKEQFQQTLLKKTRSGSIFVGSNDHGSGRGYFLIEDKADAAVAREFYTRRIAIQQENLDRLEELIARSWPNTAPQPTESHVVHSE